MGCGCASSHHPFKLPTRSVGQQALDASAKPSWSYDEWRMVQPVDVRGCGGWSVQALLVMGAALPQSALQQWFCPSTWADIVRNSSSTPSSEDDDGHGADMQRLRICLAALEAAVSPTRLAGGYLRHPACVRGAWLPTSKHYAKTCISSLLVPCSLAVLPCIIGR